MSGTCEHVSSSHITCEDAPEHLPISPVHPHQGGLPLADLNLSHPCQGCFLLTLL